MTVSELKALYDLCLTHHAPEHRRMRLLDATDNGELWKALNAKFPSYQILPDTNWVSYVKSNILASIYTVGKSAQVQPTSKDDEQFAQHLNVWLENFWDTAKVARYQFEAGERAALLNKGITRVGWREHPDIRRAGSDGKTCVLQNVDPIKFMRDPFAIDLDNAGYCMYFDDYHKTFFQEDPNYKATFERFKAGRANGTAQSPAYTSEKKATEDYYQLCVYWVWEGGKLNEYHVIDGDALLYTKMDIKPSMFPFAELFCNLPGKRLIGMSEPAKVFANNTAFNLMDSIAMTAEYKNQRPPKFISSQSGLNLASFKKFGNEADHTFVVNGPAERAVHYHEYPAVSPNVMTLKMGLQNGIQQVSGVDGRYTGRDTGSILTTGGMEDMLDRVTLIDTPKIMLYEAYASRLTELILRNFIEYSPDREYFIKSKKTRKYEVLKVPFMEIKPETLFKYTISISSELPKNKARLAAFANAMMEKQMQYGQGQGPRLLTEEEWLMMSDLPNREYMLERMGLERLQNTVEDVAQTLFTYGDLVKKGLPPDDAMLATAQVMDQKRQSGPQEEDVIPAVMDNQQSLPPQM